MAENAPVATVIYTATTSDGNGTGANQAVTYSIKPGVDDAALVAIDTTTGDVTLIASADFETKASYAFTVVATTIVAGNPLVTEQAITVSVTDVADTGTISRPPLRKSMTIRLARSQVGPSPISFQHTDLAGVITTPEAGVRFLVTSAVNGTVEKFDGTRWVNVLEPITAGNPLEVLRQMAFRLIGENDMVRWIPPQTQGQVNTAFQVLAWDGQQQFDGIADINFAVNEAPTDITLSATSIAENAGANAVVGTLGTVDPDAGNTFTYALVSGTGSTDNAAFNISGNQLRATASLDFETKSSYSIRVRSTDQGGLFTEKQFTITVTDVAVEMAFVTVGDIGNSADPATGNLYGAVDYQYQFGTYEVTIGQYTAFLNAVAADDPYGLYNTSMATDLNTAGISRAGSPGSYTYSVIAPAGVTLAGADSAADRPITYVSWFDAARFANWMHNGQGSGSTETGAYTISTGVTTAASRTNNVNTYTLSTPPTLSVGDQVRVTGLSGSGFNITAIVTSVSGLQFTMASTNPDATATGTGSMTAASPTAVAGALYRLPTENEWYKAAYYSPVKGGAGSPGYYVYATQSDSAPGNTIGDGANQANYADDFTVTQSSTYSASQNYLTNVGAFTNSASYYGAYDQSGNVYEWSEVIIGSSRGLRGGSWESGAFGLSSSHGYSSDPSREDIFIGFRLASPG